MVVEEVDIQDSVLNRLMSVTGLDRVVNEDIYVIREE